jgi:hypothetical protein
MHKILFPPYFPPSIFEMRLPFFIKADSDGEYEDKGELPLVTAASHPEFLEPMSFQLPAIGHQPTAISLQLPTIGHQPTAISLQHPTPRISDPGPRSLVQQSKDHRGRRSGVLLRRSESIYGQVNNDNHINPSVF